jgi:uncharacterized membrane protein YGL010W
LIESTTTDHTRMLCPPQAPSPIIENWLERHQGTVSFTLHLVGIPLTLLGVLMLPIALPTLSWQVLILSLGLFVGGYAFQFLGHALEGSEPGEVTALRLWWGRRAVSLAARAESRRGIA